MTNTDTAALTTLLDRVEAGEATLFDFQTWRPGLTGTRKESALMHKAYGGDLNAAKSLIAAVCIGEHQVTVDWGPSGCGAKLVWWPDGMHCLDGREIVSYGYDVDPARAMLGAVLRALIADTEGR